MGDRDAMKRRAHLSQSGVVLVAVLVVCMGLVAVTLLFTSAAMMDYHAIQNDLAGRQAEQAVEGGARYAQMLIQTVETPGTMPDRTTYTASEMELGSGYFWIIGRPDDCYDRGAPRCRWKKLNTLCHPSTACSGR